MSTVDSPHPKRKWVLSARTVVVSLLLIGPAIIVAQTPMGNAAAAHAKPSANTPLTAPISATPPAEAFPTPLIQQPPSQADIQSSPDHLTVKATNASLTQTLQRIADKTGMHVEGLSGDERVFGSFGPGAPRDVLTALLNGTSYNMIMVGSLDNGAPRQLLLSSKSNAARPRLRRLRRRPMTTRLRFPRKILPRPCRLQDDRSRARGRVDSRTARRT